MVRGEMEIRVIVRFSKKYSSIALIYAEIRSLYNDGLMEYISDLWNIVDFISNTFYVSWICLRFTAWFTVWVSTI
jgi:hypothetical protein